MIKINHVFKSITSVLDSISKGEANLQYRDIYNYLLIVASVYGYNFSRALDLLNSSDPALQDTALHKRLKADVLYCLQDENAALEMYVEVVGIKQNDAYLFLQMARILIGREKYEPQRKFVNARKLLNHTLVLAPKEHHAKRMLEELQHFESDGYVHDASQTAVTDFPSFLYPKTLLIFLTTRCNIRCRICDRENHSGIDLDFPNIYKLEKAIRYAEIIDLTGWGECFIYPKIKDVLHYIYSIKNDRCMQITTNGTLLSAEFGGLLAGRIHRLTISLNAATAETYNRDMKYSNFSSTIDNIKAFIENVDELDRKNISLHFVAHTGNFREISLFVSLAKELGIPTISIGNFISASIQDSEMTLLHVKNEYNEIITISEKIAVGAGINFSARKFGYETIKPVHDCKDPFDSCFILPDGEVGSPCCFSGTYNLGNVYESCFEDVWFNEKYERLRKARHLEACRHCMPFTRFDDVECHFSGEIKKTDEFYNYKESLKDFA